MPSKPQAQFGPTVDKRLEKLGTELTQVEKTKAQAEEDHARIWNDVFDTFDEMGLQDKAAEFLVSDGKKLQRRRAEGTAVLDAASLKAAIFNKYKPDQAKAIWEAITISPPPMPPPERQVDTQLLERATLLGLFDSQGNRVKIRGLPAEFKLPDELVNGCIQTPPAKFSRWHPDWSKEDAKKAQQLGLPSPLRTGPQ